MTTSHFYRLHTVNDHTGQSGIGVDVAKTYRPSGKDGGLPTEWRRALLSESVLIALREAGITGLKDYSNNRGEPGESIARFE